MQESTLVTVQPVDDPAVLDTLQRLRLTVLIGQIVVKHLLLAPDGDVIWQIGQPHLDGKRVVYEFAHDLGSVPIPRRGYREMVLHGLPQARGAMVPHRRCLGGRVDVVDSDGSIRVPDLEAERLRSQEFSGCLLCCRTAQAHTFMSAIRLAATVLF
ncbi:hypothetical protein [Muricoccus aerilatus]|uniref:hypothetical protein n=1 Tax=Muricoccus aerilatus TaxID=452982 RepID=UPI000A7D1036|nr:hypothetical protein [Roseomonas aerilata]